MASLHTRPAQDECSVLNHRMEYKVRVRGTPLYLWGSQGITDSATYPTPPLLHIRNDTHGELITLNTQAGAESTLIGTLQPGECYSISLQNLSGVFATCTLESIVYCVIADH
jgi:hypothetical protein